VVVFISEVAVRCEKLATGQSFDPSVVPMPIPALLKKLVVSSTALFPWIPVLVFAVGVLRYVELPGIYMDSINPDFLAATILSPNRDNPHWTMPGLGVPLLGNLYHGAQNVYTMLPALAVFGFNILAARVGQALLGGAIVALLYRLVEKATKSAAIAFWAALLLATDVAFIASFRTQNHIILDGMAWVLCAVMLLIGGQPQARSRASLIASGLFAGLGVYAYFVHAFFLPALVIFLLLNTEGTQRSRALVWWGAGLALGSLPYVVGFVAMGVSLGGVGPLVENLRSTTAAIAPFSKTLSLSDAYVNALELARLAITNGGNESMIFHGLATPGVWIDVKFKLVLAAFAGLAVVLLAFRRELGVARRQLGLLAWLLPLSYFMLAGLLGKRLWAHHFSVMLPLVYVLWSATAAAGFEVIRHRVGRFRGQTPWSRTGQWVVSVAVVALLAANVQQQNVFYAELNRTGGTDNMSDALNRFSLESNSEPVSTVFFFPEWGFWMPFCVLTGNRLSIRMTLDAPAVEEARRRFTDLQLAVWTQEQADRYAERLRELGVTAVTRRIYLRRSGEPGLFVLMAPL